MKTTEQLDGEIQKAIKELNAAILECAQAGALVEVTMDPMSVPADPKKREWVHARMWRTAPDSAARGS